MSDIEILYGPQRAAAVTVTYSAEVGCFTAYARVYDEVSGNYEGVGTYTAASTDEAVSRLGLRLRRQYLKGLKP